VRPWRFAAVLVPIVAALALHAQIVVSVDAAPDSSQSLLALARGVGYWWLRLPDAVFDCRDPGSWALILLGVASLPALAGTVTAIRQRRDGIERLAVADATLMVVPAFLQRPVTHLLLSSIGARFHGQPALLRCRCRRLRRRGYLVPKKRSPASPRPGTM
jgi:hypothetical protein